MNISLILATELATGLLSVLAIIAIVVVAGYIIFGLSGLVISIFDKKEKHSKNSKEDKQEFVYKKNLTLSDDKKFLADQNEKVEMLDYVSDDMNINQVEAEREKVLLKKSKGATVDWFKNDSENYHNLVNEDRQKILKEREDEILRKAPQPTLGEGMEDKISTINKKALKNSEQIVEEDEGFKDYLATNDSEDDIDARIQRLLAEDEEDDDEEDHDYDIVFADAEDKKVIEHEIEEQKNVEFDEKSKLEIEELNKRLIELQSIIDNEKKENKKLSSELTEKQAMPVTFDEALLKEYEDRLEVLLDRQKQNGKELKQNKKEYIPLYKIKKTLSADQEKLRRKEAIVAKQKIIIFGVNNTASVDEEKAKKLEEEIDLLDGLRLSVEHCETVMNQNKDRYPILEKSNQILTKNAKNLKADIEDLQKKIETLKKLK